MGTPFPNADAEALQRLSNLSIVVNDNNTKNVKESQPANSTGTVQPLGIEFVEKILKYEFKDKNLLLQAFTDASFDDENCVSYERLEFLGDTVLNMIITEILYFRYEDSSPGSLTRLRAVNVDTDKLARVAVKHNLHRCLRHKKPLLEDQILEYVKDIEKYPLHSWLLNVPKTLADIVESTIGALYTDCDSFETVCKVVKQLLEPIIPLDELGNHPVTELNEMCQKKNLKLKFDDSTWEVDKIVLVWIENHFAGRGYDPTKKEIAKNRAAKNALENFSHSFPNI